LVVEDTSMLTFPKMRTASIWLACLACRASARRVRAEQVNGKSGSAHQETMDHLYSIFAMAALESECAAAFNPVNPGGILAMAGDLACCQHRAREISMRCLTDRPEILDVSHSPKRQKLMFELKQAIQKRRVDEVVERLRPFYRPLEYNQALIAYCRTGGWQQALLLFEEYTRSELEPNDYCYGMGIEACVKGKQWERALSIYNGLEAVDLKPTSSIVSKVILACAEGGAWERGLWLIDKSIAEGMPVNRLCYNAAIKACAKGKRWQRALELVEQMDSANVLCNTMTLTSTMSACEKCGRWQEALSVFNRLRPFVGPDDHCYTAATFAAARGKQWELALRLIGDMELTKVPSNSRPYNGAINACVKAGMYERALSTFDDMKAKGKAPDPRFLLLACKGLRDWERALSLIETMHREHLKPDAENYQVALTICKECGQWEKALFLIDDMGNEGMEDLLKMRWDPENIFLTAIEACSSARQAKPAMSLLYEMRSHGLKPSVKTFNAVMKACEAGGHSRRAPAVLNLMHQEGIRLNMASFAIAIDACEKGADWECALSLMNQMREARLSPDETCFTAAIAACEKCGQREHTIALIDQLEQAGFLEEGEATSAPDDSMDALWKKEAAGLAVAR